MTTIPLGNMSADEFLSNYWQKKPVLIRKAFPNFVSPLEPDELAGLACSEGVMSRLILEEGGDYPWQLKSGPLTEDDFAGLSDHHWTVLVQEVDRHVPAVADLFDRFSFLPGWRKDDVMVSYASKDAGVGAHIDSYDVFLLQGSGRRRWEIGAPISDYAPSDGGLRAAGAAEGGPSGGDLDTAFGLYKEGLDVRILADFIPTETFELEPGDMLYLPPGVPHNGVAIEPCLTFSFGFLAPSRRDLVVDFALWHEEKMGTVRYSDHDLIGGEARAGLISDNDLNRVLRMLQHVPTERDALAEWFGTFVTRPQRSPAATEEFEGSFEDFLNDFKEARRIRRHEGVRLAAWVEGELKLFVDGELVPHALTSAQLELLSNQRELAYTEVSGSDEFLELLYRFVQRGWGYLLSEEEEGEDDDED